MASNPKSLGTFEVEFSQHNQHGFLPPVHRPPLVSNVPTSASPMGPLTSLRTGQAVSWKEIFPSLKRFPTKKTSKLLNKPDKSQKLTRSEVSHSDS